MKQFARILAPAAIAMLTGLAAPVPVALSAVVGDFRVLPYQLNPTLDGIMLTWFTIDPAPGTLTITGLGIGKSRILTSEPELIPVLDYQIPAELNAGGAFPFATTAIFDANQQPARNYRHQVTVSGLRPDTLYNYSVKQGQSTYNNTFRTAPTQNTNRTIRLATLADSETLVLGRTRFREWARTTPQAEGSTGRPVGTGRGRDQYFLTETVGYQENIREMKARNPDLIIMPGDLVEGTSVEQQRRWDEFWRHNAGSYDDLLSGRPLVAAIGNNCIFAGIGAGEGGMGGPNTNERISFARQQFSAYLSYPENGVPEYKDLYFRTDYGPVTILTLCSIKATDEANSRVAPPVGQGLSPAFPDNRDTNRAWFSTPYAPGDIPDFNIDTPQWNWTVQQLADARAAGQVIFVQWHHTPYSRGVHGSSVRSPQSGEAMRIYSPLLEQYRVVAIFAGHSEMSEMSYFDLDNDGYGVHLWDVGAAGDGLRGVEDAPGSIHPAITAWRNNPINPEGQAFTMNPYHVWSADQSEPELWNGNQLISGGKHYGFLEVDIKRSGGGRYRVDFQYWHTFPLNAGDANFTVTGYELRPYNNRVVLAGPADNLQPVCLPVDINGDGNINGQDVAAFMRIWNASRRNNTLEGDFNGDGVVNTDDISDFMKAFTLAVQAGC